MGFWLTVLGWAGLYSLTVIFIMLFFIGATRKEKELKGAAYYEENKDN